MIELLSWLALASVILLLAIGLTRQFATVGPRGAVLDQLTIVPQWKFFGQSGIAEDPAWLDDLCLIARISPDPATIGHWQHMLWWDDRPLSHALWNPSVRGRNAIGGAMMQLVRTEPLAASRAAPSALAYLTLVRFCIEQLPLEDGAALQFAIATTHGREKRPVSLRLLSAWHTA